MGLETAPQQSLGRIDPSSIVGKPDTSIVSPSAVAALSDAFRQGFITADDVVSRVGEHAKAKKKVELQLLNEAGSPQAQQMRAAQMQAATGSAQLGAAQTEGQIPQVPQQTAISQTALDETQARQKYGTGIDDFRALAPLAPGYTSPPTKPDGSLDYDVMGTEGNYLKALYNQKLLAQDRLKAVEHTETAGPGGVKGRSDLNAYKEDVSPGSEAFQRYSKAAQEPLHFKTWQPAGSSVTGASVSPVSARVVKPTLYGSDAQAAADAAERGVVSPTVTPKLQPTIPSVRPPVGSYVPGMGAITSGGDTTAEASKLREEMERQPNISEFRKALPQYQQLIQSEKELNNPNFKPDRVFDLRLAFNYFKALHPDTRVTEQNFKELEKFTPIKIGDLPQTLQNAYNVVTRNQYLSPSARASVVNETRQAVQGQLNAAKATVESYAKLAERSGLNQDEIITPEWKDLFATPIAKDVAPIGVNSPGQPITLSTGKKVVRGQDGQLYLAQ